MRPRKAAVGRSRGFLLPIPAAAWKWVDKALSLTYHSFLRPLTLVLAQSVTRAFIQSLSRAFAQSFTRAFAQSLTRAFSCSFTLSLSHMLVHMSRVKFACYMRSLCETLRCASPRLSYSSAVERHVVQCGLGVVDMLRVLRVMFPLCRVVTIHMANRGECWSY